MRLVGFWVNMWNIGNLHKNINLQSQKKQSFPSKYFNWTDWQKCSCIFGIIGYIQFRLYIAYWFDIVVSGCNNNLTKMSLSEIVNRKEKYSSFIDSWSFKKQWGKGSKFCFDSPHTHNIFWFISSRTPEQIFNPIS